MIHDVHQGSKQCRIRTVHSVYVCVYERVCAHECVCMGGQENVCVHVYISLCTCTNMHVHMCVVNMYVCAHVCAYVCDYCTEK